MISLFPNKYSDLENKITHVKPSNKKSAKLIASFALLSTLQSSAYAQQKEYEIPQINITVACEGKDLAPYNNLKGGQSRIALEEGCIVNIISPKQISQDGKGKNPISTTAIIRNELTGQYLNNSKPIPGKSQRSFPLEINTGQNNIGAGTYNLFIAVEGTNGIISSTPIGMHVVKKPNDENELQHSKENNTLDALKIEQPKQVDSKIKSQIEEEQKSMQPQVKSNNFLFLSPSYAFGNREYTTNNRTTQSTFDGASIRFTFGSNSTLIDASANLTRDKVNERIIGNTTASNSTNQGNISVARKLLSAENISLIASSEISHSRHNYAIQGNRTIGLGNGWPFSSSTAISGGAGFMIGDYNTAFLQGDIRFLWLSQNQGLQNNFISDYIFSTISQTGYVGSISMMVPLSQNSKNFLIANINKSNVEGLDGALSTNTTSANAILNIALPSASKKVNLGLVLGASYGTYNQINLTQSTTQKQYAVKVGIGINSK